MKDMKLSPNEQKKMSEPSIAADRPSYPYGLKLYLNSEVLEKLGLEKLPPVGEKMTLTASVEVCSISSSSSEYGDNKSMDLQIVAMELGKEKKSKTAEELLYSKE